MFIVRRGFGKGSRSIAPLVSRLQPLRISNRFRRRRSFDGGSANFQYPKCEVSLDFGSITDSVEVCFCNNCRGFVTPSQSLGQVIGQMQVAYQGPGDRPQPIDPQELEILGTCPACRVMMESHPCYGPGNIDGPGNIVLNTCNQCQLAWLDHGKLAKIIRAPGPRVGHGFHFQVSFFAGHRG